MISKYLNTLLILIILICSGNAEAQYLVGQVVFGNSSTTLSDSSYRITGTLGQTVMGITAGSSNNDYSGFWYQENSIITGVEKKMQNTLPKEYILAQNYPNPFNPSTMINYSMPKTGLVTIKVYNILGKEIATLVNGEKIAGNYSVQFSGSKLSSGVYFYRMQAGSFSQTKKLILLK